MLSSLPPPGNPTKGSSSKHAPLSFLPLAPISRLTPRMLELLSEVQTIGLQNFFLERTSWKIFQALQDMQSLLQPLDCAIVERKNSHRQFVKEYAWLCSNKTLFTKHRWWAGFGLQQQLANAYCKIKTTPGFIVRHKSFQSLVLSLTSWANHSTSLNLGFLIYKVGVIIFNQD